MERVVSVRQRSGGGGGIMFFYAFYFRQIHRKVLFFALLNYAKNSAAYAPQICHRHYPFLEPGDCKRGIVPRSGYPS